MTQIDRVVEAVEETLKGNTVHLLAKKKLPSLAERTLVLKLP